MTHKLLRLISLVLVLMAGLMAVSAQDEEQNDMDGWLTSTPVTTQPRQLRLPAVISEATLTYDGESAIVVFEGFPGACAAVRIDQRMNNNIIMLDIYNIPPDANPLCDIGEIEETYVLPQLELDTTYVLKMNDFYAVFIIPREGAMLMDAPAQQITWNEPNELFLHWREDLIDPVLSVNEELTGDTLVLNVNGGVNACGMMPEMSATTQHAAVMTSQYHQTMLNVFTFRLHPLGTDCPESLNPIEYSFDTGFSADESHLFYLDANGQHYTYNPVEGLQAVNRQEVQVDQVELRIVEGLYDVRVTGTQLGNCNIDIVESAIPTDFGTYIEIFVPVPDATPCTRNLIPYQQTFEDFRTPFIINGQVYTSPLDSFALPPEQGLVTNPPLSDAPDPLLDDPLTDDPNQPTFQSNHMIDSVEIDAIAADDGQYQLQLTVVGAIPDGCELPTQVDFLESEDDQLRVHIYRNMPLAMTCAAVLIPYQDVILTPQTFPAGVTVEVQVNSYTTSFTVPD